MLNQDLGKNKANILQLGNEKIWEIRVCTGKRSWRNCKIGSTLDELKKDVILRSKFSGLGRYFYSHN